MSLRPPLFAILVPKELIQTKITLTPPGVQNRETHGRWQMPLFLLGIHKSIVVSPGGMVLTSRSSAGFECFFSQAWRAGLS